MDKQKFGAIGEPSRTATASFKSAEQTIAAATQLTIAHGLAVVPTLMQVVLRNLTTEHNFPVGDEVVPVTAGTRSIQIAADATNLYVTTGIDAVQIINRVTGAVVTITNANWAIVARAWVQ